MTARDEVLARLRTARDAGAPAHAVEVPRAYDQVGDAAPGSPEVVERLAATLTDYRATVHRVDRGDHIAASVADALGDAAAIAVPPDLPAAWLAKFAGETWWDDPPLALDALDRAAAVVTGVSVAIATTGTFVLTAGAAGQGRRVLTLVPDHHVCVVHASNVVASVPEGIARLDPTRPLTFVSGPSATSDIELDRVEGVHGPRRLDVVLVGP